MVKASAAAEVSPGRTSEDVQGGSLTRSGVAGVPLVSLLARGFCIRKEIVGSLTCFIDISRGEGLAFGSIYDSKSAT